MEKRWTHVDQRSVVIVSGLDGESANSGSDRTPPTDLRFGGTGFIAQIDDESTWVVTCAHVVEQLGKRPLRVNDTPAELASALDPGIDLAVLRVHARLDADALPLTTLDAGSGWIPGWEYVDKDWRAVALAAKVGRRDLIKRHPATDQFAWALRVEGFADSVDGCFDPRDAKLIKGFSGAPVVCPDRRAVFAVARQMSDEGQAGYGICIEHLRALWPSDAPQPCWLEPSGHPVAAEDRRMLAQLLTELPNGLTLADLRAHAQRCAPVGVLLDAPAGAEPRALLSWLLANGPLSNGHLPLFDVVARLRQALSDKLMLARLERICDELIAWYPAIEVDPPELADRSADVLALRLELIDPGGEQRGARRYDLSVHQIPPSGPPRLIAAREGSSGDRFCPTNEEDAEFLVADLLFEWLPENADPDRMTLAFRLPHGLLGLPVDAWRRDRSDDPLGALFAVVVEDADRHRGKVAKPFWRKHWQILKARLHEPDAREHALVLLRSTAAPLRARGAGSGRLHRAGRAGRAG